MDAEVRAAVWRSNLRELPDDLFDQLTASAVLAAIPAGSVAHWEGDDAPHLELVISGLVRVYVTASDGRTMTIRYCRPGALLGVASLFATDFAMPASVQALVNAELLRMSPTVVRRLATQEAQVAHALLSELSERVLQFTHEIPGSVFTTVRQRVVRHLLDLASAGAADESPVGKPSLTVTASQRELADAAGTVREVVVRVLRELRQDGTVRTERDRIVILDLGRLIQEQGWNPGS